MLSVVSDFLDAIPAGIKELALLVVGVLFIVAAWKGGSLRDKAFGMAL